MLLPDTLTVKDVINILYAIVPEEFSHEQMATDLKVLQTINNITPHQSYLNQVYEDLYNYMEDLGIKNIAPTVGGILKKGETPKTVSKETLLRGFEKSYFYDKGFEPTDDITSTKVKEQIAIRSAGRNPFKLAKAYANKPIGHGILDRLATVLNFPRTEYIIEAYEDGKTTFENAQQSLKAPMYEIKRFEKAKNVMVTKITQLLALFPSDMHDDVLQKIIPSLFVDQGVPPDVFTQWFKDRESLPKVPITNPENIELDNLEDSSKYVDLAENAARKSQEYSINAESSAQKAKNLVDDLFEFVRNYHTRNKEPRRIEFPRSESYNEPGRFADKPFIDDASDIKPQIAKSIMNEGALVLRESDPSPPEIDVSDNNMLALKQPFATETQPLAITGTQPLALTETQPLAITGTLPLLPLSDQTPSQVEMSSITQTTPDALNYRDKESSVVLERGGALAYLLDKIKRVNVLSTIRQNIMKRITKQKTDSNTLEGGALTFSEVCNSLSEKYQNVLSHGQNFNGRLNELVLSKSFDVDSYFKEIQAFDDTIKQLGTKISYTGVYDPLLENDEQAMKNLLSKSAFVFNFFNELIEKTETDIASKQSTTIYEHESLQKLENINAILNSCFTSLQYLIKLFNDAYLQVLLKTPNKALDTLRSEFNQYAPVASIAGGAGTDASLPETQVQKSKDALKRLGELSNKWKDIKYEFDSASQNFDAFIDFVETARASSFETFNAGSAYGPEWIARFTKFEETTTAFLKSFKSDVQVLIDQDEQIDGERKKKFMSSFSKIYDGNEDYTYKDASSKEIIKKTRPILQEYKAFTGNVTSTYNTIKATLQTMYQKLKSEQNVRLERARAMGNMRVKGDFQVDKDTNIEDIEISKDFQANGSKMVTLKNNAASSNAALSASQAHVDQLIKDVEQVFNMQSSPALMSTMGDNLFAKMLNEYLTEKGSSSSDEFKARDKLVTTLEANQLIPFVVLKVNKMDRVIFVFTTLFIRLFCLTFVEFLIERGSIKTITAATFAFLGLYTAIFIAFTLMINIDLYRLRIVFNMLNMHANSGHVYMHLGLLWLIGFFIYTILTNINVFNFGVKISAINDYEKQQLMSKLQLLTLIVWCILTIIIILA